MRNLIFLVLIGMIIRGTTTPQTKPIFDGKLALTATKVSGAELMLMNRIVFPAAATFWKAQEKNAECDQGMDSSAIDIAQGSFTKPGAKQKAILYRHCITGHNLALDGIAIIENDKLVSHIVYVGGWDNALGTLPDINGNGKAEILIASGGMNQGELWKAISIIELSEDGVVSFGSTGAYSDNCGSAEEKRKAKAYRISVKVGTVPEFYREAYVNKGTCSENGTWRRSEMLKRITLDKDETEYEIIK
jgi:hypothetical protein